MFMAQARLFTLQGDRIIAEHQQQFAHQVVDEEEYF
jgi:hypothetical protein